MDEQMTSAPSSAAKIWGAVRPILPWALGLALLLLLAGLYAPQRIMSWLSWQLYLDRISLTFRPPLSFQGRTVISLGASGIGLLLSLLIGLLLPKRMKSRAKAEAEDAPSWGVSRTYSSILDETSPSQQPYASFLDDPIPHRNLADAHPDDAPRPPLRAGSELPAGGLGPVKRTAPITPAFQSPSTQSQPAPDPAILELKEAATDAATPESLASDTRDIAVPTTESMPETAEPKPRFASQKSATDDIVAGQEPWLQPVEPRGPAKPAAKDLSLSAMVARLEAGLSSRRRAIEPPIAPPAVPVADVAPVASVEDHKVDVALEAALGTLKRMNMRVVG